MSTKLVMLFDHLILCRALLLLPQSFPVSRPYLMSWLFTSGSQSIGLSASASVLPMKIQDWFLQDWQVGSPCSPRDSQESSLTPQFNSIKSSALSLLHGPTLTSIHDYWKNNSFDYMDLCQQSDVLLFNMMSSLVTAFLPRSQRLLISWLQTPSIVILEPKKIKSVTASTFSYLLLWSDRENTLTEIYNFSCDIVIGLQLQII